MFCIYKLTGENGLVYYGSTSNYDLRMKQHKKRKIEDCKSSLLKGKFVSEILESNIPFHHIAIIREGYYIMNFICVNRANPDGWFRPIKEKKYKQSSKVKQQNKEYTLKNKQKIKKFQEAYFSNPVIKQKIKIYKKDYYEKNRDKQRNNQKKNYEYKKSWGGDTRSNNNLLEISLDIFK